MAGRIEEDDVAAVDRDVIRADVLRDPAGLALRDARRADRVEQAGLAVIDVAHDRDHRRAQDHVFGARIAFVGLQQLLFEALHLHVGAELARDHRRGLGVERGVDRQHQPLHQQLGEDVLDAQIELVREILDRHALGEGDGLGDRRRRRGHRRRRRARVLTALRGGRTSGAAGALLIRRPRRHAGPLRIRLARPRRHAGLLRPNRLRRAADAVRPSAGASSDTAGAAGPGCRDAAGPRGRAPGAPARRRAGGTRGDRRRRLRRRDRTLHRARRRRRRQRLRRRGRTIGFDAQPQRRRHDAAGRGRGGGAARRRRRRGGDGAARAPAAVAAVPRRRGDWLDVRVRRRRRRGVSVFRPRVATCVGGRRSTGDRLRRRGAGAAASSTGSSTTGSGSAATGSASATARRLGGLHQARRRQHRRRRLGRLGRLLRRRAALLALGDRRLGEHVRRRQRDVALLRQPLHELARDHFLDRARGALHLDAVIALEQRGHFLARGPEELRDLEDPNSCQQ